MINQIISTRRPRVCILGGAVDHGNLGVSALGIGTATGLMHAVPEVDIIIEREFMKDTAALPIDGRTIEVEALTLHLSNSIRDRCGTRFVGIARRLYPVTPGFVRSQLSRLLRTTELLHQTDLFVDITAGDSFSDLYGADGLRRNVDLKEFLLGFGKPLVLLPQTYGPFESEESKNLARRLLDQACLIATREAEGVRELQELCGERIGEKTVMCPDVSLLMEPISDAADAEPALSDRGDAPLIGLNVSGLLYLSRQTFGLSAAYPDLIDSIVEWSLSHPRRRLVLIPHVYPRGWGKNDPADRSDTAACEEVFGKYARRYGERLIILRGPYNAAQTKYFVGQCDFMIGARMHSCIAGVSQAVPTVTLAYSKKAIGLMEQLGVPETVVDLRTESVASCVARIDQLYHGRSEVSDKLRVSIPCHKQKVKDFFSDYVAPIVRRAVTAG